MKFHLHFAVSLENERRFLLEVANDEHFARFRAQLSPYGLTLRDIPGDGNCLFRALGDQLEGTIVNHFKHRMDTVRFMIANRPDFEPFLDDSNTFEGHVDALSRNGTYAGQDCIVAFARTRKVNVVVHQLNARPLFMQGGEPGCPELHVSYHNGEHYSSVRREGDLTQGPADIRLGPNGAPCKSLAVPVSVPVSAPAALWDSASATENDSAVEDAASGGAGSTAGQVSGGGGGGGSPGHSPGHSPGQEAVVEELDALLALVMDQSQVTDAALARQCLVAHGLNAELAIDYLLNLQIITSGTPPPAKDDASKSGRNKSPLRRDAAKEADASPPPNAPPSLHCLNL